MELWTDFFSHDQTRIMGFGDKDHRGKVPFLPQHIKDTCYQHNFSLADIELDNLIDTVLPTFSIVNYYFFSPFTFCTV